MTQSSEKLSRKQVFGYLMGWIPVTLFLGFYGIAYAKFFLHYLKMEPGYWYAGLVIYMLVNMFNDPILGNIGDNTNVAKWGSRRLIYIKWGSPFYSLMFILIWWIPTNHGIQFLLFLHFVLTVCIYETLSTMVTMAWMALLPDMTMDVDERTRINFYGSIIVLIFGIPILLVSTLTLDQIKIGSLFVGAISLISYAIVVKCSKERPEYQHDRPVPLKESLKLAFQSKAYMVFVAYNFTNLLKSSINGSFLFLFWFILGEPNIGYYFLIILVVGYGSNLLCIALRKRFGMIRLMVFYSTMQVIGGLITFILILNPATEYLIWYGFIWTTFWGGANVFQMTLQSLPVDEDELKYGSRREGMFFGLNAVFTMPANSIGPIIGTAIMLAFGYVQGAGPLDQPAQVFTGIKLLFFLIPQLFSLIGILIVRKYPLDGKRLEQMLKDIEILHQKKREAVASMNLSNPK